MSDLIIEERAWDDPAGAALRAAQEAYAGSELSVCYERALGPGGGVGVV
ncbi:hypothetical protein [Dactylosporangium matsuzakiense]|nr:hypothetical protein [Dactylosporangium matsuzakiense]UWZ42667.1 hypothetical protein Dmats_34770 [Dactylosporangium matsuzakiense]